MSNIRIDKFRELRKGALVGFVDAEISSVGMLIKNIAWFCKDGKQWFNLPSEKYTDENNEEKYRPYIVFPDKKIYAAFQSAMRNEMGEFIKIHGGNYVSS